MLTRTILLAAVIALGTAGFASARSHHHHRHHGALIGHNVSLHQSGAPASVSPRGGDRAPITYGGY